VRFEPRAIAKRAINHHKRACAGRAPSKSLERPKAAERQREHGGTAPGKNTCDDGATSVPKTRKVVAEHLGMGATSYSEAKHVIQAAKDPTAPDEHAVSLPLTTPRARTTLTVTRA
jgi:hypothetical protein